MTLQDDDLSAAKRLVWNLWSDLAANTAPFAPRDITRFAEKVPVFGPAPIGQLTGAAALDDALYAPLARAFPEVHRNAYLFLAGQWQGETWVATTGQFSGVQAAPWLNIPAGEDVRHLRFGEFYKVADGKIAELRILFDIIGLAAQAGHRLLPPFPLDGGLPPGPALGNGLCLDPQDPDVSRETLQLVEDMLGGCNRLDGASLESMGMAAYWRDDMAWYGPWGVGAARGFQEFQDHAQGPSVASFPNRRGGFHQARFADGLTAAFTGWPSLQGHFTGAPFRGIPPTGGPIGQNIMDFYVRRGDKLHENWVFIDLIDFAAQCGVDLLAPLKAG